jgi:hypothetical protein
MKIESGRSTLLKNHKNDALLVLIHKFIYKQTHFVNLRLGADSISPGADPTRKLRETQILLHFRERATSPCKKSPSKLTALAVSSLLVRSPPWHETRVCYAWDAKNIYVRC